MSSYKQIQVQIARLQREANEARQTEAAAVVERLKKLIALYGLTAADVGLDDGARPAAKKRAAGKTAAKSAGRKTTSPRTARPGAGVAKYRDPKSGAEWSGFGRIPGWLASVKDREAFRIGAVAAPPPVEPPASAAEPKPAVKAASKASAKAAAKNAGTTKKAAPAKQPPAKKGPATKKAPAAKKAAAAPSPPSASEEPSPPAPPPAAPESSGQDAAPAPAAATDTAPT